MSGFLTITVSEKASKAHFLFEDTNGEEAELSSEQKAKLIATIMGDMWKYFDQFADYCKKTDQMEKWDEFDQYLYDNQIAVLGGC